MKMFSLGFLLANHVGHAARFRHLSMYAKKGLIDDASTKFYSANMDLNSAAKMVKHFDKFFFEAIKLDIQGSGGSEKEKDYLSGIAKATNEFMLTEELVGRVSEKNFLMDVMQHPGSFTMMCGSSSVGKSHLLTSTIADIAKNPEFGRSVIKIDGRANADFETAINEAQDTTAEQVSVKSLIRMPSFNLATKYARSFTKLFKERSPAEMVMAIASGQGGCLVVEEVDRFLQKMKSKPENQFKDMYEALVLNTKQLQKMSALMVFTDEDIFFAMNELNCNLVHITDLLVVGEASPQETLDWLKRLKVGPHLSELLVNVFGGHVYHISKFLKMLPDNYAEKQIILNSHAPAQIENAVASWLEAGESYKKMHIVLSHVARTGFFPVGQHDKLARVLTKYNVCRFLASSAREFSVDPTVRCNRAGLIPAGQATRMHIASMLEDLDRQHATTCLAGENSAGRAEVNSMY